MRGARRADAAAADRDGGAEPDDKAPRASRIPPALPMLAALGVTGYGALILLGLLAHEAPEVGLLLVMGGGYLVVRTGASRSGRTGAWGMADASGDQAASASDDAAKPPGRRMAVGTLLLGVVAAGGVVAYNALTRSGFSVPEWAILAYGLLLLAAVPDLSRTVRGVRLDAMVAWSFPLVAAPLGLFALDAALGAAEGNSVLDALVLHTVVHPTAVLLGLTGLETRLTGQTLQLATPRGQLALGIGLVCAGLHPAVLFGGIAGLHGWRTRMPTARLAALLVVGLAGVYVMNLVRLVLLAHVGRAWGGMMLQEAHAHLGWVLFVAWLGIFWLALAPWILTKVGVAAPGGQ